MLTKVMVKPFEESFIARWVNGFIGLEKEVVSLLHVALGVLLPAFWYRIWLPCLRKVSVFFINIAPKEVQAYRSWFPCMFI